MINTKSIKAALCDLYMNALAEQNTVVDCSKGAFFPNRLNINWAFHRLHLGVPDRGEITNWSFSANHQILNWAFISQIVKLLDTYLVHRNQ